MKNIVSFKIYEKESIDKIYRAEAIDVYNKLVIFLKEHPEKLKLTKDSYYIESSQFYDSDDLIIMFVHPDDDRIKNKGVRDTQAGYGFGELKSYGYVILCNNLIAPNDLKYISTRLNRTAFIHEYIHYLDAKRGKNTKSSISKGLSSYFNNSSEYNAFYQESIESIITFFKNTYPKIKNKYPISDFKTFKEFTIKFFDKDWIYHMDNKYRKKFNKRLYDLYQDLNEYIF